MLEKPLYSRVCFSTLQEAFDIAFIHLIIKDHADDIPDAKKHVGDKALGESFTLDQNKVFNFLHVYTARIEVCIDEMLERVYFPIKPLCGY